MKRFDPYHVWLGIPPEEQPPNHYRLLGISTFESNRQVIRNAADQRMSYLKTYAGGQHSELSQKLLNEVSAAKICLVDEAKKQQYDRRLDAKTELKTTPPRPKHEALSSGSGSSPQAEWAPVPLPAPTRTLHRRKRTTRRTSRRRRNAWELFTESLIELVPLVIIVFLGAVVLVTIGLLCKHMGFEDALRWLEQ